jgi:phage-related protein
LRKNAATFGVKKEAVQLLLAGNTIPQAARVVGVRRETVWKWTKEDDFQEAMNKGRKERMEAVADRLVNASAKAVDVLIRLMNDENQPAKVQLQAANQVLDRAGISSDALGQFINKELDWDPFAVEPPTPCKPKTY